MADTSILNTVYNQYLTTYSPLKSGSRYDTHKRSELRGIYNSIVKLNKDAPLYKIDNSAQSREYIIGLKEESRILHNSIAAVIGDAEATDLNAKVAFSTNDNIVSAKYVGGEAASLVDHSQEEDGEVTGSATEAPTFDIEVKSLATPQVNLGVYLPKNERGLEPGDYSFDVTVNGQGYEFQYSVKNEDTNFDLQSRLSRLINNSGIHLNSEVMEDGEGNSALRIESTQVGVHFGQFKEVFTISDNGNEPGSGSVGYLGIDYVAREASNAHMIVNGEEVTSPSNTFVLSQTYEVTLNGISPEEGQTATIGVKPDTDAAVENISNLIGSYNDFIKTMSEFSSTQPRNAGLMEEMHGITQIYATEMSKLGINVESNGTMSIDEEQLEAAVADSSNHSSLASIKDFSNSILRKSNQISVNPVSYINKTVVAYKNPGKNFNSPYTASAYSGFLFNSYC